MDQRNDVDLEKMKKIAASNNDEPLLMLNLNRYIAGEYPNGGLYNEWRRVNKQMLDASEGKLLCVLPVRGKRLSNGVSEDLDEVIAFWYPTHQSFLDLPTAPGAEENFRLRGLAVERAVSTAGRMNSPSSSSLAGMGLSNDATNMA